MVEVILFLIFFKNVYKLLSKNWIVNLRKAIFDFKHQHVLTDPFLLCLKHVNTHTIHPV